MTTSELSNEFDLRWDNLRYNNSGYSSLNEYEKSLYLTQAQELLFNRFYQSFDSNEASKRVLTPLVKSFADSNLAETDDAKNLSQGKFNSITITLPRDVAYLLTEQLLTASSKIIMVKPIKIDQYNILKSNPFIKPDTNRAWRTEFNLDYDYKSQEENELNIPSVNNKFSNIEILTSYAIADLDRYFCRYLMYPTPIILEDIVEDEYKIRGYSKTTEAVLNNIVHEQMLDLAIELATKALYGAQNK